LRASDEEQIKGLDVTEHGMVAYEPGLAGMPAAGDD
jgi:ammonia channel protein AmtB